MKHKQPDLKLLNEMARALGQALDSFDTPDIDDLRLLMHQLEAVTLVLGSMMVEADVPLRIAQQALARTYAHALDSRPDDGEQIH
jgi:hypothetical protein